MIAIKSGGLCCGCGGTTPGCGPACLSTQSLAFNGQKVGTAYGAAMSIQTPSNPAWIDRSGPFDYWQSTPVSQYRDVPGQPANSVWVKAETQAFTPPIDFNEMQGRYTFHADYLSSTDASHHAESDYYSVAPPDFDFVTWDVGWNSAETGFAPGMTQTEPAVFNYGVLYTFYEIPATCVLRRDTMKLVFSFGSSFSSRVAPGSEVVEIPYDGSVNTEINLSAVYNEEDWSIISAPITVPVETFNGTEWVPAGNDFIEYCYVARRTMGVTAFHPSPADRSTAWSSVGTFGYTIPLPALSWPQTGLSVMQGIWPPGFSTPGMSWPGNALTGSARFETNTGVEIDIALLSVDAPTNDWLNAGSEIAQAGHRFCVRKDRDIYGVQVVAFAYAVHSVNFGAWESGPFYSQTTTLDPTTLNWTASIQFELPYSGWWGTGGNPSQPAPTALSGGPGSFASSAEQSVVVFDPFNGARHEFRWICYAYLDGTAYHQFLSAPTSGGLPDNNYARQLMFAYSYSRVTDLGHPPEATKIGTVEWPSVYTEGVPFDVWRWSGRVFGNFPTQMYGCVAPGEGGYVLNMAGGGQGVGVNLGACSAPDFNATHLLSQFAGDCSGWEDITDGRVGTWTDVGVFGQYDVFAHSGSGMPPTSPKLRLSLTEAP